MSRKYNGDQTCPHCVAWREQRVPEMPEHPLACDAYSALRVGLDTSVDSEARANYILKVRKERRTLKKIL